MKGDKDGKKENGWEGRWLGGKFKSDDVLPSLTVDCDCRWSKCVCVIYRKSPQTSQTKKTTHTDT